MATFCPHCKAVAEHDSRFCTECGARFAVEGAAAMAPARPAEILAPLPPLVDIGPLSYNCEKFGTELVVEVETNRPMVHGHTSMLRLRVTSNLKCPCCVTLRVRLHGQGRFIDQDETDLEQSRQLRNRGDQHIFSFPFLSLRPGYVVVRELRVTLSPLGQSGDSITYELPDQSLFVYVSDPAKASASPGVVISGGIHIDFSKLQEVYGSDIGSMLNLNAVREAEPARPVIAWQPIAFRVLPTVPPPAELRLTLSGGVAMEFVRIRAGEFMMGSPEGHGRDDERPQRLVRIQSDFYFAKFPVTQEQFEAVLGRNPSQFVQTKLHPVDSVCWGEARAFCRRLKANFLCDPAVAGPNSLEVAIVGLPTEAEWEYACRAGTATLYSFGDDRNELLDYCWFDKNSDKTTQAVGQLRPNPWGLFDMHGNVWEWCDDFYAADYMGAVGDGPRGPATGDRRVLRGGSWSCYSKQCRSACRHAAEASAKTANYGFRVVVRMQAGSVR
jgi:formylglycine-generating enzyme required for sulfatase activity